MTENWKRNIAKFLDPTIYEDKDKYKTKSESLTIELNTERNKNNNLRQEVSSKEQEIIKLKTEDDKRNNTVLENHCMDVYQEVNKFAI